MIRHLCSVFAVLLVAGCATSVPPSIVSQPTVVRPVAKPVLALNNGSIYQAGSAKGWFEDKQPHQIGDNITIQLEESINASAKSGNSAERSGNETTKVAAGTNSKTFGGLFNGLNLDVTHDNKFTGQGATSSSNTFNGLITVMVNEILPNGNLSIAGEKQVSIRGETSYLRVSGVVNPSDIQAGNVISSTRIAEARIEEVGTGTVAAADKAGWLQRFFFSYLPF
ncbi:MAG: flagellar basal body L-ring protein FlgH [Burkholderiales bacterium]|nr:flagellar basal body L-ring protein FlgH [Burkholderiales bacterium]